MTANRLTATDSVSVSRAELVAEIARRGFAQVGVSEPAIVVAPATTEREDTGTFTFTASLVLPGWQPETPPATPAFHQGVPVAAARPASAILVVPPIGSRALTREAGSPLASMELHEVAAQALA